MMMLVLLMLVMLMVLMMSSLPKLAIITAILFRP